MAERGPDQGRSDGRRPDEPRPLRFDRDFIDSAPGSCLVTCGRTRVICTAIVEDGVPPWRKGSGQGWLTAEYGMLPGSTDRRKPRDGRRGGIDGRSVEIQRLVGRALRPAIDMSALGERTVFVDCDVIQADGGTRTTAINGAWVALRDALEGLRRQGRLATDPLRSPVAAISVGVVHGEVYVDLDHAEDRDADADMNVVMDAAERFLEVQATAERAPITGPQLSRALELAQRTISEITAVRERLWEDCR
jgi:ribonuclease PH